MTKTAELDTIPRPVEPGTEMDALRRFHRDGFLERNNPRRGDGIGNARQVARGKASHHWIQDGHWVVGDYEQDQL